MVEKRPLSHKQEMFCQQYIKHFNATKAAAEAGYSKASAYVAGSRNLRIQKVADRIDELQGKLIDRTEANADILTTPSELIEGYTRDLRFDPRKLYDDDGNALPITELPDDIAMSLLSFDMDEQTLEGPRGGGKQLILRKYKYKFPNKNTVRDSVSKMLGLTNGNKDIVRTLLEAIGMVQVNVQNNTNTYNMAVSDTLRRAIESGQNK